VLYKVTPSLAPQPQKAEKAPKDPNAPKVPRKKRKSAVYDAEGNEVLITMMCLKCRSMKPLTMFGLRKMADGAIRNQPWCRSCRSGAGGVKPKPGAESRLKDHEKVEEVAEPSVEAMQAAEQLDTMPEPGPTPPSERLQATLTPVVTPE
jgi:hypothetical protein